MRKLWTGVALTLLVAHGASAALQYEFIQTSRSDSDNNQGMDFSARATIDGRRSRVDFISGNTYPPGTYVISTDGAHKLFFVDPTQKAYTELNTMTIASAIGTTDIKIENFVPSVTRLDDSTTIAGIPADHYRLTMTYDITVTMRNMAIKQSVRATIDKWTTVRFGDNAEPAFASAPVQTGNAKIDEMIATETTRIKGFPLKQSIQITTINNAGKQLAGSELKIPSTRTRTREMTVTSVGEVKTKDSDFSVPAEFRKLNFAEQAPKSQTQILSLEPASK